jgi:hypothetical protein
MVRAVDLLNENERWGVEHIRCGAHVLNLMVKKVINYQRNARQARELVRFLSEFCIYFKP